MTAYPVDHASPDLRDLVTAARRGVELTLTDAGRPVAQVVPIRDEPGSTQRLIDALRRLPPIDYAAMRREHNAIIDPSL